MYEADYPHLTPQELQAVGQALYGAAWRAELAHALGVAEVDVVMIEAGRMAAPAAWRGKLVALAQDMALRALDVASTLLWRATAHAPDMDEAPPKYPAPRVA